MARTVIVTGSSRELVHSLIRGHLLENDNIITNIPFTTAGNSGGEDNNGSSGSGSGAGSGAETEPSSTGVLNAEVNFRSPLSVRSMILKGLNTFGELHEALITFSFGSETRVIHDLPLTDIEKRIDQEIKGKLFLLKELITHFWKKQHGSIAVILHTARASALLPLDAAIYGSIRELTESLFTQYKNEPLSINGYESFSPNTEDFASFILKIQREKGERSKGKWFRHGDKQGILSGLSFPRISNPFH